ncbi:ABC transporter ATP-binding protein [Panacibacter ginsenosidivorans]|uniref:ABC transporter ATP-binding protein n=1 Tax=Panacibacter ginsenosidivorans TaxID=1813871 RepID=A0A5B8V849_9BACT|nr:ABC transporter ATP-binding protein [Panacibacter ginsenosidivorans]QEC66886.1 ABC transporter ATP-binding protein [Panacibacter ginsenosidivorans]
MALLEVQHISKHIAGNLIVDDINFKQGALQKVAIAGESGAGKTTLLKIISGHAQADSGTVLFNGKRVIGPEEKLLPGHKEIAYLSQEHDLLHNYKVEELVWFENQLTHDEAATLFEICQIDHLLKRKTDQLSGGEKQRIALCMLLIKSPKMLILDEPFSNLDPIHTDILKAVLEDITGRLQITCMLTSHDPHDTLSWADEVIVMKEGKIIQQGTPQTIYHKPVNEYVAGMFGKYNLLNPEQAALFGIEANGKNVMLRPEEFVISTNAKEAVKGIIQKISFWGSFYEAEVLVNDVKIVVRMMRNEWKVGEEVCVNVNK